MDDSQSYFLMNHSEGDSADESMTSLSSPTRSSFGGSCWRRWKWKCLGLPRTVLFNRRFIAMSGFVLILIILYVLVAPHHSLMRYLHQLITLQNPLEYNESGNRKIGLGARRIWQGGGSVPKLPALLENSSDVIPSDEDSLLKPSDIIAKFSWRGRSKSAFVLVLSKSKSSALTRSITEFLVANKFRYIQEVLPQDGPIISLSDEESSQPLSSKFACIVFEDFRSYLNLLPDTRQQIDIFMKKNGVGMIAFLPNGTTGDAGTRAAGKLEVLKEYPLTIENKISAKDIRPVVNKTLGFHRVVRTSPFVTGAAICSVEAVRPALGGLIPRHDSIVPVEEASVVRSAHVRKQTRVLSTAVVDVGLIDGIRRAVFGGGLMPWLRPVMFMDALSFIGGPALTQTLQRYILVDVDDIFVAKSGIRMTSSDVKAMLDSQERLRARVPGFTYNLGFSGFYFMSGTPEENLGDKALVGNASSFWWFDHMWRHTQPHKLATVDDLRSHMALNKHFAKTYNLTITPGYSVAPHHSGVYPVHEQLYSAWKRMWGIRATSTEEYPHLKPDRLRRGFVHRGVMVLPRQMCGLFTHTIKFESEEHPGLKEKLDASITGGELFVTILSNPISVFMTHMTNYASDRLAPYVFENVVKHLQLVTNLDLRAEPPLQLARRYFDLFPEEAEPIWGNPCKDKRHIDIWSVNKSCSSLPDFLVLGPQKTGTTALYTFLGLHPGLKHNMLSPTTFEEMQFFSGNNYFRGIDWYMKGFPAREEGQLLFEKSATYFDSKVAPQRVKALLPDVKLVALLLPPERRAYSWYQHQINHGVAAAVENSFSSVLRAVDDRGASKAILDLRERCLQPGQFARHLRRWLTEFEATSLHLVDGELLRTDPVAVMNELQKFLGVQPVMNYSQLIRYNPRKGFFCQVTGGGGTTKCLGKSKGKKYAAMSPEDEHYLKMYFAPYNTELALLMQEMGLTLPEWLQTRIEEAHGFNRVPEDVGNDPEYSQYDNEAQETQLYAGGEGAYGDNIAAIGGHGDDGALAVNSEKDGGEVANGVPKMDLNDAVADRQAVLSV